MHCSQSTALEHRINKREKINKMRRQSPKSLKEVENKRFGSPISRQSWSYAKEQYKSMNPSCLFSLPHIFCQLSSNNTSVKEVTKEVRRKKNQTQKLCKTYLCFKMSLRCLSVSLMGIAEIRERPISTDNFIWHTHHSDLRADKENKQLNK